LIFDMNRSGRANDYDTDGTGMPRRSKKLIPRQERHMTETAQIRALDGVDLDAVWGGEKVDLTRHVCTKDSNDSGDLTGHAGLGTVGVVLLALLFL
jgi:hypothetical protein